jgi:hypothetical protein
MTCLLGRLTENHAIVLPWAWAGLISAIVDEHRGDQSPAEPMTSW